jgi:hypothetical protein
MQLILNVGQALPPAIFTSRGRFSAASKTRACSVETLLDVGAGERIVGSLPHQPGFNRVLFNVVTDSDKLCVIADEVIVRLFLPEGLAGAPQIAVRFWCARAFQRAKKECGRTREVTSRCT